MDDGLSSKRLQSYNITQRSIGLHNDSGFYWKCVNVVAVLLVTSTFETVNQPIYEFVKKTLLMVIRLSAKDCKPRLSKDNLQSEELSGENRRTFRETPENSPKPPEKIHWKRRSGKGTTVRVNGLSKWWGNGKVVQPSEQQLGKIISG
ncbi:hypothetical protein QTP88_015307 [Uroleucon formosanum]